MANEVNTMGERMNLLEQQFRNFANDQKNKAQEANIDFWRMQNMEAKIDMLGEMGNDLVDEDSFDGIDPITRYFGDGDSSGYNKQFELATINSTAKTFSIKAYYALTGGLWIAGVEQSSITDGAGMTWNAATSAWDADAIAAESYVYLLINKTTSGTSIVVGTTKPAGTSSVETWPLWRIGYSSDGSGSIVASDIDDLRDAIHVPGFA